MAKRRADKISDAGEWQGPDFGKGLSLSDEELAQLRAMRERLARAEREGEFAGKAKARESGRTDEREPVIGTIGRAASGAKPRPVGAGGRGLWFGWPAWVWVLAVGIVATVVVQRFDVLVNGWAGPVREGLGPDLRREWTALQQFGQGSSIAIVCVLVWCLDPKHRYRLGNYAIAMALAGVAVQGLKVLVGRPRPRFEDAATFLWPWGRYAMPSEFAGTGALAGGEPVLQHAWDGAAWKHAQLWSMPSSHAAFACVLAVFLWRDYPRVRWLGVALAVIAGCGRLMFDAHWASDVAAGACVGVAAGLAAIVRK